MKLASIGILERALAEKQMSGYALALRLGGTRCEFYGGNHGYPDTGAIVSSVGENSLFDLASLTKIFSTMNLLAKAGISLDEPYKKFFLDFPHAHISLRQLTEHRSGYPAHIEFFQKYRKGEAPFGDREALRRWIYETPLKNPVVTEYSDLGFLLLGFLLEKLGGASLPDLFEREVARPLGLERTGFVLLPHYQGSQAPSLHFAAGDFVATERCEWRQKMIQGEVHDDNTWALGGAAGHAGLFSTAKESLVLLEYLVASLGLAPNPVLREKAGAFITGCMAYPGLRAFPGSDFAGAYGHTGFVGTSAWHSPQKDLSVVLLTNRVHPSRNDNRWITTRLEFHQSLWNELT